MAEPGSAWLPLLLGDVDAGALEKERLRRRGTAPAAQGPQIDAEARMAVQLQSQLREQRKRAAELSSLYDLALRLSGVHEVGALLQDTVAYARSLLGVDIAYLALLEPDGSLTIRVTDGAMGHRMRGVVLEPHSGLAGRVVELAAPVQTPDYLNDEGLTHLPSVDRVAAAEGVRAILGAPLRLRGDVLGVLMVSQRDERSFTVGEVSLLSSLGALAAVAIDNARLIEQYRSTATELARMNDQLSRTIDGVNRAAAVHETLLEIASRGGGIPDVVLSLSTVMDGTILYADSDDQVVTAARGGVALSGPRLSRITEQAPSVAFAEAGDRRSHVAPDGITTPVGTTADYFGALQVQTLRAMADSDIRTLERAATTIALIASTERALLEAERRTASELLEQLVTRRVEDEAAFTSRARHLGLDLGRPHAVAVVQPSTGQAARVLSHGQGLLRQCPGLAELVLGDVLLVAQCDPPILRDWLAGGPGRGTTGIAGPATGTTELASAYDDAHACVAALLALGRDGDVATVGDLGPYRFLLSHAGRDDAMRFVELTVGALLRHDAQRGTELARTAYEFLASGRHHAATAAALHVHPNTLYQRLERVSAQLGSGWREGDRAHDVQMALRLSRLVGGTASTTPQPEKSHSRAGGL